MRALTVAALAACVGCGTTTTITRSGGANVSGYLEGGDADSLYLEFPSGNREQIPRSDIRDISYPGGGATVVGGILSGYGVLNIFAAIPL